ncbi:putative o-succinylbenzoate--CoA ligase [Helianthus annuus]|nr:putative o-succinylbenzoate--CoA ligase [Helianthus annuus]KAJ0517035.1 putative o-succinylbenzoate--CoA ligase [Helianthus annuus]KAJ0685044.1 putative o-succinylbenzoate--CoA ligase [Helianthus annuus]KAJ0688967.1 putative o-succinylbenzoate--CoA ligase [Helianthus annuus]KAJ0870210.1 putative o-succinylbenzoate--CoA ligase [Helianthus annuus]
MSRWLARRSLPFEKKSDLYLEWLLAITYVGAIAATLNYRWSLEEALLAMQDVKPIMLVTDNEYTPNWHSDISILVLFLL